MTDPTYRHPGPRRRWSAAPGWVLPTSALWSAAVAAAPEGQFSTRVTASAVRPELPDERAVSVVTASEMEQRLPRSAPDALRYEAGVFVQQSAHGQGSAFLRGLTGQQTLLLFDGVRLNNSTYRQGPNQYFFTLDAQSVASIAVLRGGGSTRGGSDAMGGVLSAVPLDPLLPDSGLRWNMLFAERFATADKEAGGRVQLNIGYKSPRGWVLGFIGGVGGRSVGMLESAGPVLNPNQSTPLGPLPYVPRYAPDLRTQLGTGFKELTADGRLVWKLSPRHRLTLAAYVYREYDAPRTDQCPPPTAPFDTCMTYDEQFRHLAYLAWDAQLGAAARELRVTLSVQHQHERRRFEDPSIVARRIGLDDVVTVGLAARAATHKRQLRRGLAAKLLYGFDTYVDLVNSTESLTYTDVNIASPISRGQYLTGSVYVQGGAFVDGELFLGQKLTLRAGGRLGWAAAKAPMDRESGTQAVDQAWFPVVGHVGMEFRAAEPLRLLVNVDNSFRAPNLNDLTARQQTGPGFQFENAALLPEQAWSFEVGARLRSRFVQLEVWGFETLITDAVLKVSKRREDCPLETPQCLGSWSRFKLENAPALSEVRGVEATARAEIPGGLYARTTLAYAWGEGPRVGTTAQGVSGVVLDERVPLSRVPPLNGTVEVGWEHAIGVRAGAAMRWATLQDRLAIADYSDGRIPKYGTPGFAVLDLRLSFRLKERLMLNALFENVADSPYRYHGSSINGPGRGLSLSLKLRIP